MLKNTNKKLVFSHNNNISNNNRETPESEHVKLFFDRLSKPKHSKYKIFYFKYYFIKFCF